ncbi:hypothetical protein IAU60_003777 [Kwoniella sp. DSM 27419]
MSTASRHLLSVEAEERKLQGVYDDISSHCISSASSTLNRYLKKNPKSQPGLTIKMYILQKTGADETDILAVYENVKALGEMSGRGIWWTGMVLRNMGRLDLALQLYTSLAEKMPDSHPIQEQVFLHAAAAEDLEVLVKSSRKLFNLTREDRWGRAAAWSEWVKNAPQPTPDKPYPEPAPASSLKIASLLLNTSTKSPSTSETLWLKSQILISAGQLDEALEYLVQEGADGALARLWWRLEGVKEVLGRMENKETITSSWQAERVWVTALLEQDSEAQRNYAFYQYLLLATEHNAEDPHAVTSTDALLRFLHNKIGSKERAPALARLALQAQLSAKGIEHNITLDDADWLKNVEAYWTQWASKGSIVSELEGIARPGKNDVLRDFVSRQAGLPHSDEQAFREVVNAEIYLLRQREAAWMPSLDDADRHWKLYKEGLQYGRNLPKTDVKPADTVGLVTVSLLITIWHQTRDPLVLLRAILCLERIVEESPACAHARYLLIRLYRLIGAPRLISSHLEALKLSEIKLDNLLHVYTERGGAESVMGKTQAVWADHADKAKQMYKRTSTDFPEYVKECLSNETYSKIPSIRYLNTSIAESVSQQVLTIEQTRLIIQSGSMVGEKTIRKLEQMVELAQKDRLVDLRNWELVYEIGGNRPLVREMTELGPLDSRWIGVYAGMLAAVGRFMAGQEATAVPVDAESLSKAELAIVTSVNTLVDAARKASEADGESTPSEAVAAVFDTMLQACQGSEASRWGKLQSLGCLSELSKIVDLSLVKIGEMAKPSKGKKKSPALVQLATDLKTAKEACKEGLKAVSRDLDALKEESLPWDEVAGGWFEDENFYTRVSTQIDDARRTALENAKMLLLGANEPPSAKQSVASSGRKKQTGRGGV